MNNYIYTKILAPVIQNLYSEMMVIGIFLVSFSYLRSVFLDVRVLRYGYFWRRVFLLLSVMLFSIYIGLSYNVDIEANEIDNSAESMMSPKAFFLLIAPLELVMVGIEGAMFLILGYDILDHTTKSAKIEKLRLSNKEREKTLAFLFGATGLWHILCIIWWLFWLGNNRFSAFSVCTHATIATVHLISLFIWGYISSSKLYVRRRELCDWIGVVWYFGIILAVYLIRMGWYADTVIKVGL